MSKNDFGNRISAPPRRIPRASAGREREIPLGGRREIRGTRRDVRPFPSRPGWLPVSSPRGGRPGLCRHRVEWVQRRPDLRRSAPLAAGSGREAWPPHHGRLASGAAHQFSRRPQSRAANQGSRAFESSRLRGPPCGPVLCDCQRDSRFHRALARRQARGTLPPRAVPLGEGRRPGRALFLC